MLPGTWRSAGTIPLTVGRSRMSKGPQANDGGSRQPSLLGWAQALTGYQWGSKPQSAHLLLAVPLVSCTSKLHRWVADSPTPEQPLVLCWWVWSHPLHGVCLPHGDLESRLCHEAWWTQYMYTGKCARSLLYINIAHLEPVTKTKITWLLHLMKLNWQWKLEQFGTQKIPFPNRFFFFFFSKWIRAIKTADPMANTTLFVEPYVGKFHITFAGHATHSAELVNRVYTHIRKAVPSDSWDQFGCLTRNAASGNH